MKTIKDWLLGVSILVILGLTITNTMAIQNIKQGQRLVLWELDGYKPSLFTPGSIKGDLFGLDCRFNVLERKIDKALDALGFEWPY